MHWITEDAQVQCTHQLGKVTNLPSQDLVTVQARRVLVQPDPVGRTIAGCPNIGVGIKPCTATLVVQRGYSEWIRIDGQAVCLDSVTGFTDGTPPGVVKYEVAAPGQTWIAQR